MEVVLASASPRRRELLKWVVPEFTVCPSTVEEVVPETLPAVKQAAFLAELKARDVARRYPEALVIGSDTTVVLGERVLGKPKDPEEAVWMLNALSGRRHRVITGCALFYKERRMVFSETTYVDFYPLTKQEIAEYIATGEGDDKAGSYAIQGRGALLVRSIVGDYYTVVGLPVARLKREIERIRYGGNDE